LPVINGEITKTSESKFSLKIEEIVMEEKENYDGGKKKINIQFCPIHKVCENKKN